MKVEDQEKTCFIMPFEAFCYIMIPFGLKNTGATYQRCIQNCPHEQIGHNVHAYVDNIVVKSQKSGDLIADLTETFANLQEYNMKLNPMKCIFGIPAEKLVSFIFSERGIKVNPKKIDAILKMEKPHCIRDVQRLAGCITAVSRFISRLGEKALPLYRLLKKADKFFWNAKADASFEDLKKNLSTALVLAAPLLREPMLLYIMATNRVISIVMLVERKEDGKAQNVQRLVYYVSKVLMDSK
jgi:hypothetical protein